MPKVKTDSSHRRYIVKIDGVGDNLYSLESFTLLRNFKQTAKVGYISIKRRNERVAITEWFRDNKPTEYFAVWHNDRLCRDDSFEIWYK